MCREISKREETALNSCEFQGETSLPQACRYRSERKRIDEESNTFTDATGVPQNAVVNKDLRKRAMSSTSSQKNMFTNLWIKFLEDKQKLLEEELDDDEDRESCRSRISRRKSLNLVKQWLSGNADEVKGDQSQRSQGAASLLSQSPDTRNQRKEKDDRNDIPNLPPKKLLSKPRDSKQQLSESNLQDDGVTSQATGNPSILSQSSVTQLAIPGKPLSIFNESAKARTGYFKKTNTTAQPPRVDNNLNELIKQFGNLKLSQPGSMFGTVPIAQELPTITEFIPTPSQLAARQVMPRDLPTFSGDPADWPVFISSFMNTTLACGYSSVENMSRLQRCLKGQAYEAVRSRLLLPESVPQVVSTLQLLYGRPEMLITALLEKIHSVPAPKTEKLETLLEFGMAVQSLCDHLEAAGQHAHLSNPALLMELVDKLRAHVKLDWGGYLRKCEVVNLKTFSGFISEVMLSVSKVIGNTGGSKNTAGERTRMKQKGSVYTHMDDTSDSREVERLCTSCKKPGHRIQDCRSFRSTSVDDRWKFVQLNNLCRTCLNAHGRRSCRNPKPCGINGCQSRHHPLLHSSVNCARNRQQVVAENHTNRQLEKSLLFPIVPVTLRGPRGVVTTFALLDDGSSMTLIEEGLARQIGAVGIKNPLCLVWTANVTRREENSMQITLNISGTRSQKQFRLNDVQTVRELSLPKQTIDFKSLASRYQHLRGLPIASYDDAVPRLLIGVNNVNLTVPLRVKEGQFREPIAVKTRLGWCVYGGETRNRVSTLNYHACNCTGDQKIHDIVKNHFELEEIGTRAATQLISDEDKRAQRILEETTVRKGVRFESGLLWRYDRVEFPDSYQMALRRLECLERKMIREPQLKDNLHLQMKEYQLKGYAHRATQAELANVDMRRVWYLPIGAVTNPMKPGKVRIIWDAAAKVDGISLNSMLLKGPDQLVSLPAILSRFRQFKVAVSADIQEMFHQISIRPDDRHSQRFLWRSDPSCAPEVFLMDVATFGSSCSPATAQYVKNKNAEAFAEKYPRAVNAVIQNHYVDDLLDSFESEEEASRVAEEIRTIHRCGGFNLRNWLSNSKRVDVSHTHGRVLGMLWITEEDVLCFSTSMKEEIQQLLIDNDRPTKRQILKCLMGFFDPLGLLSVFLVHGKVILQSVWRSGIKWDEKVNEDIYEQWRRWILLMKTVETLKIPRCYFVDATSERYRHLQLHIFVDASEVAYAALAYFRTIGVKSKPECVLVAAKSKVAPLKPLSIPRLELQAAVLGVRLMQFVKESHSVSIHQEYLWSDSLTVLGWLRSDHLRYRQYVACRVGELLTSTSVEDWRWVPSKQNPADQATKWGKGPQLNTTGTWFSGPEFLQLPEKEWPQQKTIISTAEEELRPIYSHRAIAIPELVFDFNRVSKYERAVRAMVYVLRFIENLKRKKGSEEAIVGLLNTTEIQTAERKLIQLVQWQVFGDEMVVIRRNLQSPTGKREELEKSSNLYPLTPIMDEFGILRMDGRIGAARNVSMDVKFPVILPKEHKFTHLLIDSYHRKYRHANFETVVNEVRQMFYVPRLRAVVKKVIKICQWCRVQNTKPRIPRMAPLPAARLSSFCKPFTYVGLDFFGPLTVKIGAERLLKEQVQRIQDDLVTTFTGTTTRWLLIPPAAPHMGGAWERLVRSIKTAMETTYNNDRKLDDEELETMVFEAEGIVNSRPLTYLPLDAEESEALTPNHFLLGSSNGVRQPVVKPTDPIRSIMSSWDMIQLQLDRFWKRWTREYLPTLTRRTKWFGEVKPLAEGDLVFIVDESKRNNWIRGRVQELIKSGDGRVRQAVVKTARGIIRRPVAKLAVLDVASRGKTEPDVRK
ncbi:uncharacterized protein LOC131429011 [Malaya genurostris]|uniref:uncharacterized protein LOC131429011 n=1 Tax=Malaya genurostris TaxID=325434 RepID=UPI0026F37F28|nr:uncharacterized protein LOC131429011 [Malaya genurostris]